MDGRVQLPVIGFLQKRFQAKFVDTITEAGPNLILSEQKNQTVINSIFERLKISVNLHKSVGIAIVGHHDCAGNPAPKEAQIGHLKKSVQLIQRQFKDIEILGLWVDENWNVEELKT
jgi:carbonic anhydrase